MSAPAPSHDEWRGDLCVSLRAMGLDHLADEAGAFSDQQIADVREVYDDPHAAALALFLTTQGEA